MKWFDFSDDLGPEKVVHIHRPAVGLSAIVVVDNTAAGPSIGGVRMAPDVSLDECARLARAMTLKNGAAGLPHGGGKAVIAADPSMDARDKARLMRAFAQAIDGLIDYIPGPDMGTNETCMAWVLDEIGRAVGLPAVLGGIPLDEIGATGLGVAISAEAAEPFCDVRLDGARVAVQGFGAVGLHAARQLVARGATLVAAADSTATLADPAGLDLEALAQAKRCGTHFAEIDAPRKEPSETVIMSECDILVPAARPDVIHVENAGKIRARLVLQGANIPATEDAERMLHDRGVLVVPDFIANAGGVICAAVEVRHGSASEALELVAERIRENTGAVLSLARERKETPRAAAVRLAMERVRSAVAFRRFG